MQKSILTKRFPLVLALVIGASMGSAGLAYAGPVLSVTIFDTKGESWTMSTDDARVKVLEDRTDRTNLAANSQTTDVRKVVEFDSMAPVKVTFTQDNFATQSYGGAAKNTTTRSGLNFNLENIIFNFTGISWSGFAETLTDHDRFQQGALITDANVGEAFGRDDHPAKSHFHPIAGTNPPTHNPPPWGLGNDPNGENLVLYTLPPNVLDPGQEFDFNIKIHDIVVADFQRRFDLLEIPLPEPGTLALVGLGLAALVLSRRGNETS